MSRRRWIFLGLTLSSAVVFLIDRVLVGEPAKAEAATSESRTSRSRKNTTAPAGKVEKKSEPISLFDPSLSYLERLTEPGSSRDVFSLSSGMLSYYKTLQEEAPQEGADGKPAPRPGTPQAFAAEHKLQATSIGEEALAIIDGKPMRVGDELDGFRLTRIGPYEAEFERGSERAVLSIPTAVTTPTGGTRKR